MYSAHKQHRTIHSVTAILDAYLIHRQRPSIRNIKLLFIPATNEQLSRDNANRFTRTHANPYYNYVHYAGRVLGGALYIAASAVVLLCDVRTTALRRWLGVAL